MSHLTLTIHYHDAFPFVCIPHSVLNASLDVQRPAVGAILNYTVAINTINQTLSLTSMTNTTIRALLETVMVDELQSASSLLATSDALLMMAQQANISVTRLLQDVSTARSQVMLDGPSFPAQAGIHTTMYRIVPLSLDGRGIKGEGDSSPVIPSKAEESPSPLTG